MEEEDPVMHPSHVMGCLRALFRLYTAPLGNPVQAVGLIVLRIVLLVLVIVPFIVLGTLLAYPLLLCVPAVIIAAYALVEGSVSGTVGVSVLCLCVVVLIYRLAGFVLPYARLITSTSRVLFVSCAVAMTVLPLTVGSSSAFSLALIILAWGNAAAEFWVSATERNLLEAEEALYSKLAMDADVDIMNQQSLLHKKTRSNACFPRFKSQKCTDSGLSYVELNGFSPERRTLVMISGYSGGKGMYAVLYPHLKDEFNLIGLDLYGSGGSERPYSMLHLHEDVVRDLLVEKIEIWRRRQSLGRFILLGHSMGGHISTLYAARYSNRIEHLVLASPLGVEQKPENDSSSRFPLARIVFSISTPPHFALRFLGPLGPSLTRDLVQWRFGDVLTHPREFADYAYQINAQPVSFEAVLFKLFVPVIYAKKPLIDIFPNLNVPTLFLYGQHDWMNKTAGNHASRLLSDNGVVSAFVIVEEAGHQLFLENTPGFCRAVLKELKREAENSSNKED